MARLGFKDGPGQAGRNGGEDEADSAVVAIGAERHLTAPCVKGSNLSRMAALIFSQRSRADGAFKCDNMTPPCGFTMV